MKYAAVLTVLNALIVMSGQNALTDLVLVRIKIVNPLMHMTNSQDTETTELTKKAKAMNGTSQIKAKASWLSLVNALALAIVGVITLIGKAIEMQNFQTASTYLVYLGWLSGIYIILRLPQIIDEVLSIFAKYSGILYKPRE